MAGQRSGRGPHPLPRDRLCPPHDTPEPPAHSSPSGCWRRRPEGAYRRSPGCLTAALGRFPSEGRDDDSASPGTASASAAQPMPRHSPAGSRPTRATSRHLPHWPRPYSGRPSPPGGARRSGLGRGLDIGAACRRSPCWLFPAGRLACVLPIRRCPAPVSCAGGVLPSRPSPRTWLSHALRPLREKTPHPPPADLPCHRPPPPAWLKVPSGRLGSSIVLGPGFPFRA
jgi:hypothetical protein